MPLMPVNPVEVDSVSAQARAAVIVGGGIGALAAGISLTNAGWTVSIYEKESAIRASGGALMLWPNATRALQRLGVLDAVKEKASIITTAEIRHVQGCSFNKLPVGLFEQKFGTPCLVVQRSHLLRALADQLAAVGVPDERIHFSKEVVSVDHHAAVVRFADGTQAEGNVIIGADGVHSAVRASIINDGQPSSLQQWAFVGMSKRTDALHHALQPYVNHADFAEISARITERFASVVPSTTVGTVATGLRFWYATLPGDWVYWYAVVSGKRRREEGIHTRDDLARLMAPWGQPTTALVHTAAAADVRLVEIHYRKPISSWHRGRVAVLGDAAQPMSPDLGQGAGMALEQAVTLGWALEPWGRVDAALGRYSASCISRTAAVASASRIVAETSMPDDSRLASLRDQIWNATPDSAAILHLEMLIAPGVRAPGARAPGL